MKRCIFLTVTILLIYSTHILGSDKIGSIAQTGLTLNRDLKADIGARLIYAHNLGNFGNRFGYNAFGAGGNLGYALLKKNKLVIPIAMYGGLNFDYLWFGGKQLNSGIYTINVNSNAYGWSPYVKLAVGKTIKVYGYGTFGYRFFYGRNKLTWEVTDSNGNIERKSDGRNFTGDASFFSGIGGGLCIGALEVRMVYNAGRNAAILDPKSIVLDANGNLLSYLSVKSLTDMWLISLGISL